LGHFLTGQISVQFLNLILGFLLLRWFTKAEFAQFGLAFAFQGTVSSLVDLGFSGSIVALVGENKADRGVVGKYIDAARTLRGRLSVVGIAVSCLIFPVLALRQGWSINTTLLLLGAIIATVLFQNKIVYSAPLLIYNELKPFYRSQTVASCVRLITTSVLYVFGLLSAASAACVVAISTGIMGTLYQRSASSLFQESRDDTRKYTQEMIRYLSPMMPVIIFSTLQNQIVIALAAWFGKTANIAEVAALGRLAQLFLVLGAFNAVIVQPYIAGVPLGSLVIRYLQILSGAVLVAGALATLGFVFPEVFLWILGKNYAGLGSEVSLSIGAACLNYIAGVMFTMNAGRKWVFWWSTALEIFLLIVIDILCVRFVALDTTLGLMKFSLITGATFLAIHAINGAYGLYHRNRLYLLTSTQ